MGTHLCFDPLAGVGQSAMESKILKQHDLGWKELSRAHLHCHKKQNTKALEWTLKFLWKRVSVIKILFEHINVKDINSISIPFRLIAFCYISKLHTYSMVMNSKFHPPLRTYKGRCVGLARAHWEFIKELNGMKGNRSFKNIISILL